MKRNGETYCKCFGKVGRAKDRDFPFPQEKNQIL
jgi:hypothetical protein